MAPLKRPDHGVCPRRITL